MNLRLVKQWGKVKERGRGEYYWLVSLRWSQRCDTLLGGHRCPAHYH